MRVDRAHGLAAPFSVRAALCQAEGALHPSWCAEALPAGLAWRPTSARSLRIVSQRLRRQRGLPAAEPSVAAPAAVLAALLEMPSATLAHCVEALGLALLAPEVRRAIARQDAHRYRTALGPTHYQFALHSAELLLGPGLDAVAEAPVGAARILAVSRAYGLQCLRRFAAAYPPGWGFRLSVRVPHDWHDPALSAPHFLESLMNDAQLEHLVHRVLRAAQHHQPSR